MKKFHFALLSGAVILGGCGGSGGSPFAPASLNTGSSIPVASKIGKRPIAINIPLGVTIVAVAPNGKMLGSDNATTAGWYWSSPTATPVQIPAPGYTRLQVSGINSAGQIVGTGTPTAGNAELPLFWASPTSNPTAMQSPAGQTDAFAVGINASGQIVGLTGVGNNEIALYWATSTSAPAVLTGAGGSNQGPGAALISDGGRIYGIGNYNPTTPGTWASPTANGQALGFPAGTMMEQVVPTLICMCASTGEAGSNFSANEGITTTPVVWPLPGLTMTPLTAPAGNTGLMFLGGIGKNHVAYGSAETNSAGIAVEWNGFNNPYTDLNTLLPAGTGWALETAQFVDDAGDIIGQGKSGTTQFLYYVVNFS